MYWLVMLHTGDEVIRASKLKKKATIKLLETYLKYELITHIDFNTNNVLTLVNERQELLNEAERYRKGI